MSDIGQEGKIELGQVKVMITNGEQPAKPQPKETKQKETEKRAD